MTKKFEKNFSGKHIIKMNTKTVRELRSIAKDKGFHGCCKLKKADLVAFLLEQSSEEMPTPAPRGWEKNRRSVAPVKIIPDPQEIKSAASKAFSKVKNSMLELHDSAEKTMKGYVEGEARKENQEEEEEEDADLTPHEHERALKRSYRSFMILVNLKQMLIATLIKQSQASRR